MPDSMTDTVTLEQSQDRVGCTVSYKRTVTLDHKPLTCDRCAESRGYSSQHQTFFCHKHQVTIALCHLVEGRWKRCQ
jgi:hypothetical protein